MRRAGIVGAAGLCVALSSTGPEPASFQRESGPIVMRSRNDDVGRHNLIGQGRNIGASLWESAPPFVVPRLCQDILSRGAPMATGTADLTFAGSFVDPNPPGSSQGMYGMTGQGTMRASDGSTMRVNAHYRCTYNTEAPADAKCTQGVVVSR